MLSQSTEALSTCRKHLDQHQAFGTEIEAYLVRYCLVVICAEIESLILSMVVRRAQRSGDTEVAGFVDAVVGKIFRRIRTGEMGDLLRYFYPNLKVVFNGRVNNTLEQVALNKIVDNRHNMAHGRSTVNMTFSELLDDFDKCKVIIQHFAEILGVEYTNEE